MRPDNNPPRREGNPYDKIIKENIDLTLIPLISKLTGWEDFTITERLTEKLQTTTEREVDFLAKIKTGKGKELILHIEYQSNPDQEMNYRIGEYHGIIQRKYQLPIKHLVIYLGKKPFNRPASLPNTHVYSGFTLLHIHNLDFRDLLNSDIPEEVVLAILANFKKHRPEAVMKLIFQKLQSLSMDQPRLTKFVSQLGMLSRLRKLDSTFKITYTTMPITYDITEDTIYQDGIEKGIEKGREEEKSFRIERERKIVQNLDRAGNSLAQIVTITGFSRETILNYLKEH